MSKKAFDTDDERGCAHRDRRHPQDVHARQVDVRPEPVTFRTLVRLAEDEAYLSVVTDLRYDSAEPYSVFMVFNADTDMTIEWTFGRELLLSGRQQLSGVGDIQIWPSEILGSDVVFISFRSGEDMFVVAASAVVIGAFLEDTLEVVSLGEEKRYLGIESAVSQLLGET
ncbi:SsgA family sporulation/cell division regulator [Streptomyces albicerus]|jgi:hypothetical protein|uniref:SsgA family sporulation/cell division regulator n=1 Tax=Streptomyces albicerus TaxID=2569859 RepID=UPI00124B75DC|nr:SsgA family sporulation/cell division regulator [Streptomyces albicerus]